MKFFCRALSLFCVILTLLLILPFSSLAKSAEPSVSAKSAVLYEAQSQKILFAKNENQRMPMASTTKIMTALAVLDTLSCSQTVTIPRDAVGIEGSSAYLKANEVWTVKDLLYALLLQSANDAAVALAIASDGSVSAFAERMNEKAKTLGLCDTHFENPHGLHSENHYTTAKELALIAAEMMKNPLLRQISATKVYRTEVAGEAKVFVNHNKLLSRNKNAVGVKTGFTKNSGRCLVGATEKDGLKLISVTLNASNDWNDHEAMWSYALSEFTMRELVLSHGYLANVPVSGALVPYVTASNREPVRFFMKKSDAPIHIHTEISPYVLAPIRQGEVLGYLCFTQSGDEIKRVPLYANTDIPKLKIK